MSKKKLGLMIYVVHPRTLSKTRAGKWDIYEEVYIKNGLRSNLLTQSTIVLDCVNMEVYKNRSQQQDDFYTIITYLSKSHQQVAEFKEVYDSFLTQMEKVEEQMKTMAEETNSTVVENSNAESNE